MGGVKRKCIGPYCTTSLSVEESTLRTHTMSKQVWHSADIIKLLVSQSLAYLHRHGQSRNPGRLRGGSNISQCIRSAGRQMSANSSARRNGAGHSRSSQFALHFLAWRSMFVIPLISKTIAQPCTFSPVSLTPSSSVMWTSEALQLLQSSIRYNLEDSMCVGGSESALVGWHVSYRWC
jgi:hypothetical protein